MPDIILAPIASKTCSKCGEVKLATTEFFTKKLDSLTSWCKVCLKKSKSEARKQKSEEINAARRSKNAALFPDELKAKRENDRQRYARRKAAGEFTEKRPYTDSKRDSGKKYYANNRIRIIARQAAWSAENTESIRDRMNVYFHNRRRSDPLFSIGLRVRALIGISLRSRGLYKSKKSEQILGCSIDNFAAHLEKQFHKGMTWDNRSDWHIDHIQPLATAKTEEDVIAMNHFTNLRPMWAKDNLAKGAQITHLI